MTHLKVAFNDFLNNFVSITDLMMLVKSVLKNVKSKTDSASDRRAYKKANTDKQLLTSLKL